MSWKPGKACLFPVFLCNTARHRIQDDAILHTLSDSSFADALAHWGAHEADGRLSSRVKCDSSNRLVCLNLVLQCRAPYVARLIAREPVSTHHVAFEPQDAAAFVLADGSSIERWIEQTTAAGGEAYAHFRRMVENPAASTGRIVCAACVVNPVSLPPGAVVLYDGWHRAAAWVERNRCGKPSTLEGYLIVARHPDPLLLPAASS